MTTDNKTEGAALAAAIVGGIIAIAGISFYALSPESSSDSDKSEATTVSPHPTAARPSSFALSVTVDDGKGGAFELPYRERKIADESSNETATDKSGEAGGEN